VCTATHSPKETTDGLTPVCRVCRVRPTRGVPHRRRDRSDPRVGSSGDAGADRGRGNREDRRSPLRADRGTHHRAQRRPSSAVGHPGRRCGAEGPQAAQGIVLPGHPRTTPAHRPGALCGGDGGLRVRGLHPQRRRPGHRARHRLGHLEVRSVADLRRAGRGRRRLPRPATGRHHLPLRLPTSTSTPPTCTCATAPPRSPRWPWSWPPASAPTAAGRSLASTWATARTRCSGAASSPT
jgi:hypothetical protein